MCHLVGCVVAYYNQLQLLVRILAAFLEAGSVLRENVLALPFWTHRLLHEQYGLTSNHWHGMR